MESNYYCRSSLSARYDTICILIAAEKAALPSDRQVESSGQQKANSMGGEVHPQPRQLFRINVRSHVLPPGGLIVSTFTTRVDFAGISPK